MNGPVLSFIWFRFQHVLRVVPDLSSNERFSDRHWLWLFFLQHTMSESGSLKRKRDDNDDLLLRDSQHTGGAIAVAVPAPITLSAKPLDDEDVIRGKEVDILCEDESAGAARTRRIGCRASSAASTSRASC